MFQIKTMESMRASQMFRIPKAVKLKRWFYYEILKEFASKARVLAALDESVQVEYKPKHHPGIIKVKAVEMPSSLVQTIVNLLKDQPIKPLLDDANALRNYLHSRQAPLDSFELQAKTSELVKQVVLKDGMDENLLSYKDRTRLKQVREAQSRKLIGERIYSWKSIDYDDYKCKTYLLARSASDYAVLMKVFQELKLKDPEYSPKTLFDFGSGVGTVTWAVRSTWTSVKEYFCVDKSSSMNELADLLLRGGDSNNDIPFQGVFFRQFLPSSQTLKYDLVVSAFSLLELPSSQSRLQTVANLWNKCSGYLVLVEDGTFAGSKVLNEARDFILEFANKSESSSNVTAHVVIPCPHDLQCPKVKTKRPCSFPVDYKTLPVGANLGNKRVLHSYVVLRKGTRSKSDPKWPRIVQPVLARSRHVICRMCCSNGNLEEVIFTPSKHGTFTYHCARASNWGDLLPVKLSEPVSEE